MKLNKSKLKFINIGCGLHPIEGWTNYDNNKFIFIAKIKLVKYLVSKIKFIPTAYKTFISKVIDYKVY